MDERAYPTPTPIPHNHIHTRAHSNTNNDVVARAGSARTVPLSNPPSSSAAFVVLFVEDHLCLRQLICQGILKLLHPRSRPELRLSRKPARFVPPKSKVANQDATHARAYTHLRTCIHILVIVLVRAHVHKHAHTLPRTHRN